MALTPKQQRFCQEYLIDLNATQAAIRAGYAPGSAEVSGSRLLRNAKILALVDNGKADRSAKTRVDAAYVLSRLHAEAEADLADLYDYAGNLLPVAQWPRIWRTGLVTAVDYTDQIEDGKIVGRVCRIKLRDRTRILELLGKHTEVQAFRENNQVGSLDGLGERLDRAAKRFADNVQYRL